ncbi:hypothetical protein B1R94_25890 [Mycolicibacterium litorale]|nr:hypothetical protein B1R94_25890 [Mycolicibacterium litorale]
MVLHRDSDAAVTTFAFVDKVAARQPAILLATGDSTVNGASDTAMSGWVGRTGVRFGQWADMPVMRQQWGVTGTYTAPDSLHTGTGTNQILVRDAGMPGWTTQNVNVWLSSMLSGPTPDLIIHGTGFNDINAGYTPSQYVTYIHSYISAVKARCPGVPIIITTENVANSSSYDAAFNALATDLTGHNLPLTPALQATNITDVYLMDTRQAFGNIWQSALMTDTLHPNAAGYQAEADWIFTILTAGIEPPAGDPPTITTLTIPPFEVGTPYTQTLEATGAEPIEWAITEGEPPDGITFSEAGELSGTPIRFQDFAFKVRASNDAGQDYHDFAGTVRRPVLPFIPTDILKPNLGWHGMWYRIVPRIQIDGQWRNIVPRH